MTDIKQFAASLGGSMPELDLHGLYPNEALEKLESFIFACYKKRENRAKIIYGFGTGKLREEVTGYLNKHPLVDEVFEEGGNCVIIISNS